MIVLDASALLALINREPGWGVVARAAAGDESHDQRGRSLRGLAEGRPHRHRRRGDRFRARRAGHHRHPFGRLDARLAASSYRHRSDLSLADRVCLALGRSLSRATYTTGRNWLNWADDLGVQVVVVR